MTIKRKNPQTKQRILQVIKPQKSSQTLPKEVGEALRLLSLAERRAYATALHNAGWTLQSIGTELKVSREAIRLYTLKEHDYKTLKAIEHLPVPEVPLVEVYVERVVRVTPDTEVIAQLKELRKKAFWVRGKGKGNREEAEAYTKLLYETVESGVSVYRIAKELGVTTGAIQTRLVRYGYRKTQGKSKAYRQLTHRKETNNA